MCSGFSEVTGSVDAQEGRAPEARDSSYTCTACYSILLPVLTCLFSSSHGSHPSCFYAEVLLIDPPGSSRGQRACNSCSCSIDVLVQCGRGPDWCRRSSSSAGGRVADRVGLGFRRGEHAAELRLEFGRVGLCGHHRRAHSSARAVRAAGSRFSPNGWFTFAFLCWLHNYAYSSIHFHSSFKGAIRVQHFMFYMS